MSSMSDPIRTGVFGVGSMGQHHARVYSELAGTELVGVFDVQDDRAADIASEYGTESKSKDQLLDRVDAVSIAVPTEYHFEMAMDCIEAGVDVLIEKPFVENPEQGTELIQAAQRHNTIIQVGHLERFNPAVETLRDVLEGTDIISIEANRLGPPIDRELKDNVVKDLMIHDIDILLDLIGQKPKETSSVMRRIGDYAKATFEFPNDIIGELTASRVTQRKVRTLSVTAADCYIELDYLDQSVEIHRQSVPEYITQNGDVRYRHESVIERPQVSSAEPLKKELAGFVSSVKERSKPRVTGEDGLDALEMVDRIVTQSSAPRVNNEQ